MSNHRCQVLQRRTGHVWVLSALFAIFAQAAASNVLAICTIIGAPCRDGNSCTSGDRCIAFNVCAGVIVADGTPCDGDVCTQAGTCQAGVCTGASPVTCATIDPCHDAGTCNPASGICSSPPKPCAYPPNFQLLTSDNSWGGLWTQIIPGKFTSSAYTSLLFFNQASGYAELYETDGNGAIVRPALRSYAPLGGRTTWTHVIPGYFGSTGLLGLLLYDQPAGFARFFQNQGNGNFVQISQYSGWRNTWTQIVPGMFTTSSRTSLFFYSPSEQYAEIWETNATGLNGVAPYQSLGGLRASWTNILAADFFWTPGYIASAPILSDLVFYEGSTGWTEMYRVDETGIVPYPTATGTLAPGAANAVTGNFGGTGNSAILLHNRSTGEMQIYTIADRCSPTSPPPCTGTYAADFVRHESMTGLGTSVDLVIPGQFYRADAEDHWFGEGASALPQYDAIRNWRAGTGEFTDLLLYDRSAGTGRTFLHEPLPPPQDPLAAYITSSSSHAGGPPVSSGSVLPGESIAFHVSSTSAYTIKIYRKGYFAGGGTERFMTQVGGLFPATGPQPIGRRAYRDGAQWPTVATLTLPNYGSGYYVARFEDTASPPGAVDVPFIVRASSPSQTKILLVTADVTYAAYNDWGGRNVYGYADASDVGTRAFLGGFPSASAARIPYGFEVSFDRPVGYALGNSSDNSDIPFLRWLGWERIPVDVSTGRDLAFAPLDVSNYRLVVFVGHHEYWSREMRDKVDAFARAGGNVGIFSGNTMWWQVRLSSDGTKLDCYKIKGFDPYASVLPTYTTVNWWDDPVLWPETSTTGLSYYDWGSGAGAFGGDDYRFKVVNENHWALQGTALVHGDQFGAYWDPDTLAYKSVVGTEVDRFEPAGQGLPAGMQSPSNFVRAASVLGDPSNPNSEIGTMGSFVMLPGTGEVFNAGTINWALGLADVTPTNRVPKITRNVFNRLGPGYFQVTPGAVNGLRVSRVAVPAQLRLDWNAVSAGPGTEYDVARGLLSTLRSSGFPAGASCVANALAVPQHIEGVSDCAAGFGNGCWYLVRAKNSAGVGTYSAALDASTPCSP